MLPVNGGELSKIYDASKATGRGWAAGTAVVILRSYCQIGRMRRKKTTVYIDENLLRAAKMAAARSGQHEYEIFETALREHLGVAGTVERIWAGIDPDTAPDVEEAARIAAEELAAVRSTPSARRAG